MQNVIPAATSATEVLFVDTDQAAARLVPVIRHESRRVTVAYTRGAALQVLSRATPDLIITELDLSDGPGEDIIRRAKELATPPSILVTTPAVDRIPAALLAGCDGVLLKPFAPNLLSARMGRMLRERSIELRLRAHRQLAKSAHLNERSELLASRTTREWPNTHCPSCQHRGVTSFEHTSHRRSWYACLACSKVWIAARQEEWA
jgi:DNA-binding response OmpR family regulator